MKPYRITSASSHFKRRSLRAFTLVELLVVIAIIGVMVAMTIPAVQASRESARRSLCHARIAQLGLALQSYENSFEMLPAGVVNPDGPIRNEATGLHQGWMIQVLPYIDEGVAYKMMDFSQSVYAAANAPVRQHWPQTFICPSEPLDVVGASNYAGCHHEVEAPIAADNRGVLFLNSHVRRDDITDGQAYTIFIAEKLDTPHDLGWMSGTRATLRNTGLPPNDPRSSAAEDPTAVAEDAAEGPKDVLYVGGFASAHPSGLHVAFGDGSVRFISETIDLQVWQKMGNRADGQLLNYNLSE